MYEGGNGARYINFGHVQLHSKYVGESDITFEGEWYGEWGSEQWMLIKNYPKATDISRKFLFLFLKVYWWMQVKWSESYDYYIYFCSINTL